MRIAVVGQYQPNTSYLHQSASTWRWRQLYDRHTLPKKKILTVNKGEEGSGEEAPPPKKTRTTRAGSKPLGRATHNVTKVNVLSNESTAPPVSPN